MPRSAPTTISAIRFGALDVPLIEPFAIATGAQPTAQNVLVELQLADGTRGYGEAAPFPAVTGETQASTLAALAALRLVLVGRDVQEWRRLAAELKDAAQPAAAARCALETALLDALTKRVHMPLWAFFGGASTALETDMTITAGSVAHAAQSARAIAGRGIGSIKIKIGGEQELDVDRIVAVHEAAPDAPLILDGNCGYDAERALQLLAELRAQAIPVALFEQPVTRYDLANLARVTGEGGVLVAADESVTTAEDALRIAQMQASHVVNIKLMKAGVVEGLAIAAICRAAGIELMIGGMVETLLAMNMSAHFAAGLGGFRFVDLDTPMFMAEQPFRGGWQQTGGRLSVGHVAGGHGVEPINITLND
ncbi:MAG: dipeptide epimerase [Chloroflexota bacterium]|nr:dipeptide epimerase [Chloroflexota bacterium]